MWKLIDPYPVWFTVAFNKKELKKLAKEKGIPLESEHSDTQDSHAKCITGVGKDGLTSIMVFLHDIDKEEKADTAGIVAHECMHAVQSVWEAVCEDEPGKEAEAYLIQRLVEWCYEGLGR
jgi:hypothetical protein